jgi:BirA family biotin operon repressor/biotin-[acetyl-CoA-carboxylase] ligase
MNWGAEALWLQLVPLLPGISIEVLPSTPSTNTLLLERVRNSADVQPCLLVAEEQTAGRGRMGRQWLSQAGESLTFSLALPLAPADWAGLSLAVGLALAEALDPVLPGAAPRIGLKWPNDLWLMDTHNGLGRKLGGILIETVNAGGRRVAVVGIGLNLLPLPAQPQAGSESGYSQGHASLSELVPEQMPEPVPKLSAPEVLARVAEPLLQALLRFEREGFAPLAMAYARRDVLRGLPVNTTLADLPDGVAQGVDDQGALLLQRHGVPHRVVSGEVSVRLQREAVL